MIASGRVQGVYYRASLKKRAVDLGLKGYVRNLPDGTVEAVVIGEPAAINALKTWCWEGPPLAEVDDIAVSDIEAEENFSSFEIRK